MKHTFDFLAQEMSDQPKRYFGIKLALSEIHESNCLLNVISENMQEAKIILTKRSNLLEQFGSLQLARKSSKWHSSYSGDNQNIKVKINKLEFDLYLYKCMKINETLSFLQKSNPVHHFSFEDFANANFQELFEFLGLSWDSSLVPVDKKVSPKAKDFIINYDNWKSYFQKCEEDPEFLASQIRYMLKKNNSWFIRKSFSFINKLHSKLEWRLKLESQLK